MNAANNGNLVVQGLWIGGRLSTLERLCIRSYCAHGHKFHLYHYDELRNVPRIDGLRLMDGEQILPRAAIFRNQRGVLAYFSDHFRYELLCKQGGWWADMDTVCVRPLDLPADIVFQDDFHSDCLWNGILKFPRGHFLAAALADAYEDINRVQPWDSRHIAFKKFKRRLMFWRNSPRHIRYWHAGGMGGLMSAVRYFGLEKHILPTTYFYLPGDPQGRKVVESAGYEFKNILSASPDLRCIHMSNNALNAAGVNKDDAYPADSLYEVLKRRYPEAGE